MFSFDQLVRDVKQCIEKGTSEMSYRFNGEGMAIIEVLCLENAEIVAMTDLEMESCSVVVLDPIRLHFSPHSPPPP